MTPADAPGLAALIGRCYGDAYPKRVMYRPAELAEMIRTGAYDGVVAVAGDAIVGHIGFSWPAPGASVVEAGTTVVDPRARGQGLMGRLGLALAGALIEEGASGFVHFPTTAHAVMQRASLSAGGRETGLMLAYLPAETRDLALDAEPDGRLAVTVVYQPVAPAPAQAVHLPARHRELVLGLARELGLERRAAGGARAPAGASRLERVTDSARGLERVTVERIGADLADLAGAATAPLVHVDLPMNDPGIDGAVEALRRASFAFAAWLPGWAGHDVLRLQRVASPTAAELAPAVVSPEAEALLRVIRAELLS